MATSSEPRAPRFDDANLQEVATLLAPHLRRTPVIEVDPGDFGIRCARLTVKLELLQHAGSFKTRGAFSNLLRRKVPEAGVTAASGGNHGAAVAYAAARLGHKARIFVPTVASPAKVARIRACGAEIVIDGERYADALALCEACAAESGALAVHAYDAAETLEGQATLGRELREQAPGIDTLLVAVGGGGLIGGIAGALRDTVKLVGVEPATSRALHAALEAGMPVDVPVSGIAADSLGARRVGELVFPLAREYVERVVLVSDDDIARAQGMLWERLRIVAEPGGAAGLAALVGGAYAPRPEEHVGVLVCGGNTDVLPGRM